MRLVIKECFNVKLINGCNELEINDTKHGLVSFRHQHNASINTQEEPTVEDIVALYHSILIMWTGFPSQKRLHTLLAYIPHIAWKGGEFSPRGHKKSGPLQHES